MTLASSYSSWDVQTKPLKVVLNIAMLSTKKLNITLLRMTVTEILSVCTPPTLILLVTKMDNSTNHRCHGITATDGNYALVSGDLYTNAYNIKAMEVS